MTTNGSVASRAINPPPTYEQTVSSDMSSSRRFSFQLGNLPSDGDATPPPLPPKDSNPATEGQAASVSAMRVSPTSDDLHPEASSAHVEPLSNFSTHGRAISQENKTPESDLYRERSGSSPILKAFPYRQKNGDESPRASTQLSNGTISQDRTRVASAGIDRIENKASGSRHTSRGSMGDKVVSLESPAPLQYHHQLANDGGGARFVENRASRATIGSSISDSPSSSAGDHGNRASQHLAPSRTGHLGAGIPRPSSAYSSSSELGLRGRSPQLSPGHHSGPGGRSGRSPDARPMSFVDLLNVPYPQPAPAPANIDNAHLRTAVGSNASLLSTKQTLEMYRANVKKTNDPAVQYEFAIFMINAAQEIVAVGMDGAGDSTNGTNSQLELLREARQILQRLSDRSYPFAQYYLGDGYSSGLFSKGKEDNDRAFPLFIAASKHGHAEAGYRAALCYEFGWGTRKDPQKAVQFYRQSASKNHPGAMSRLGRACLAGEMGLGGHYREGLKWLKRAAESADFQYNSAPYELGLLHETGYGEDVFRDESYAAQLFTQSADLGHVEANYRLGDAYEHGTMSCPKDPALSVHFYTGAAQRGHPLAMMALCAWYMVGAEPVLEKDENEAYEWAKKAAECGT